MYSQSHNRHVPYDIILLSNYYFDNSECLLVSVPYEIILLSNSLIRSLAFICVSVPYGITLLSNVGKARSYCNWFQYLMKLHYSQTIEVSNTLTVGFSTL